MKKRIKETVDSDGKSRFNIQEKFIWWFTLCPTYFTKEDALKAINYNYYYNTKYHYIGKQA